MKGVSFEGLRDAGDPAELAVRYRDEGADEIVFLDITASISSRKPIAGLIRRVASDLDIPFTIGGGVAGAEDAKSILDNGADKISLNTAAIENPSLVTELSDLYGAQCVVVAIDAKRSASGVYEVFGRSGTSGTGMDAAAWAARAERLGAGELLVTSIDRDGTKAGYDLRLLKETTGRVNVPVIASGGCGRPEHFLEAFREGGCDAALAASVFHYGELTISEVKEYLSARGVLVRR